MSGTSPHRKRVKHYHEPGDLHELTFSCYRRMPLLTNDAWRKLLARQIDQAVAEHSFQLAAFVLMPEHVHLLVYPLSPQPEIDRFLASVKQPFSAEIKLRLQQANSRLIRQLTVRERPGKTAFRFWQEGPGYDRNLNQPATLLASINYIHMNPVTRGLVDRAVDWKWSSARHYLLESQPTDFDLPVVHGLPSDYLL